LAFVVEAGTLGVDVDGVGTPLEKKEVRLFCFSDSVDGFGFGGISLRVEEKNLGPR